MGHSTIQLSLQKEGDDEPVDGYHAVGRAFQEKEH